MLKPYSELRKLDVMPFCEVKKGKDERGRTIDIPYLNWAKCVDLLHEYGAESVYYTPIRNTDGSYLFCSREVANKDGRKCGCYFVSVEIHIDDLEFTMDTPLLNGNLVVYDDTLNQLRISNAHARAFVKGVALRTGLGFDLWVKGDEIPADDDLSIHSMMSIKKRVEELITVKLKNGMTKTDICKGLGCSEKQFATMLNMYDKLYAFEAQVKKL